MPFLKPPVVARTLHKWLGLLVGLQVLIWLATGLYMVVVDIDFIHGDTLVKNTQQPLLVPGKSAHDIASLRAQYQDATKISLRPVMGKTFYTVTTVDHRYLVDPQTGAVKLPLDENTAREIARYHYAGEAQISNATLISSNPPMEIQTRRLPLWRVDFDDRFSTSFYIDPYNGSLATRRHQYWRIFDFLWALHIMDYEDRSDAHNRLLIFAQFTGLTFAVTGLWLLFYSFSGRRRKKGNVVI
ncbi:MAG: PepSY domain-containing protein [Xanthomonadales bacterium]|nr:PepSY domain-containing protein [Xanthomonadales bacterium]